MNEDEDQTLPITVFKGIEYGFVRMRLDNSNQKDDCTWHLWSLFVRGSDDHDMSLYVQKVTFIIHGDFIPPVRAVYTPPYEISEFGRLSFEAAAEITFRDKSVKPVYLSIPIRFTEGLTLERKIIPDNLVFLCPKKRFALMLEESAHKKAAKISGIYHHIEPAKFIKEENKKGIVPYIYDPDIENVLKRELEANRNQLGDNDRDTLASGALNVGDIKQFNAMCVLPSQKLAQVYSMANPMGGQGLYWMQLNNEGTSKKEELEETRSIIGKYIAEYEKKIEAKKEKQ